MIIALGTDWKFHNSNFVFELIDIEGGFNRLDLQRIGEKFQNINQYRRIATEQLMMLF